MNALPSSPAADPNFDSEAVSSLQLLRELMELPDLQPLIDPNQRPTANMVYTHGVVLFGLVAQRLGGGLTLNETVSRLIHHHADLFPPNKRTQDKSLSENSGAYSRARSALQVETAKTFSETICKHLAERAPPSVGDRRVFIFDGTTITLAPTPQLKAAFPPSTNQFGESVWPIALLVAAHDMGSACAWLPKIVPMYGPHRSSETAQARIIIQELPKNSIIMGDCGFGVFSVAHAALKNGHDFLFRLADSRFKALLRKATLIMEEPGCSTWEVCWRPSSKDRQTNPDIPKTAALNVTLHALQVVSNEDQNQKTLYTATSLNMTGVEIGEIYRRRYDMEFDIRDLKVTLDVENIRAVSKAMFEKEFYASVAAYNLTMQFRRQAAERVSLPPRRLSFTGVWTVLKYHLLLQPPCSPEEWAKRFEKALSEAGKRKLPNRKKPRSYPRKAHPRRPKSTKFMKQQAKANATQNQTDSPPEKK